MNYIELFSGCGGLSLGLESLDFKLLMANELSPMASETYAYNFFNEEIQNKSKESKALWLSSQFHRSEIQKRLREDPRSFPKSGSGFSDLTEENVFSGNLVIGDIAELNKWLDKHPESLQELNSKYINQDGIDLVSGGPPCQSFSMAGLRQLSNERNSLPWEFVKFVTKVKPKFVLLENVTGILRAFKDGGNQYYAWYEVAKSFAQAEYIPLCLHINAKYAGVAQNRPRFIFIGIRKDIYKKISQRFNKYEYALFGQALSFIEKLNEDIDLPYGELRYFDTEHESSRILFENSFLSPIISTGNLHSVEEAIDDLRSSNKSPEKSTYLKNINAILGNNKKNNTISNHEYRNNSLHVQRRFRIYQILLCLNSVALKETREYLKGNIKTLSNDTFNELKEHDFFIEKGSYIKFSNKTDLMAFLKEHQTKKQTQKALISENPAPAALSIPDDTCHYHHDELRTLTVREMARIQSFPDSFVFRSKITTGGQLRKFEVPQYTQVGNAVPPLLGRALGQVIKNLSSYMKVK